MRGLIVLMLEKSGKCWFAAREHTSAGAKPYFSTLRRLHKTALPEVCRK